MAFSTLARALLIVVVPMWLLDSVHGACKGRQSYVLSIQMSFTPNILATVPEKARVPIVVAVAHSPSFNLFKVGDALSDEVAQVVETGRAELLISRLERLKDANLVSSFSVEEGVPVDEVTKMEVTAEDDSSLVSVIAPLSPSPSWFAGISSHDLCNSNEFVPERSGLELVNYNGGLEDGSAFGANLNPYPEGESRPVGPEGSLSGTIFAKLSLEEGTLGVDWWKIFLGVLVAVAVGVFIVICIVPRCRRKRTADIPLTAPDGVQW